MTLDEFLEKLGGLKGRYEWNARYDLRGYGRPPATSEYVCPITAVCLAETGRDVSVFHAPDAAKHLGLSPDDLDVIIRAADSWATEPYVSFRKRMEEALGL